MRIILMGDFNAFLKLIHIYIMKMQKQVVDQIR